MRRKTKRLLCALASDMRRRPTPAERELWDLLRDRRCLGLKFRRQVVVGGFILDFYCARPRIAIEVDGPIHSTANSRDHDRERDRWLTSQGAAVLRIPNSGVDQQSLESALTKLNLRPPSPHGGEGDRG